MNHERRPGLDGATPATDLDPSAFVDRVMDAIEATPAPTPARSFIGALRGSLDDAVASLAVAWHLATVRSWSVAPRVRARSIALVLAVASVLATGSLVAAAAVRVVVPVGMDDHHVAPPTVPVTPSVDPRLDEPGTNGSDTPTPADADHHVIDQAVDTDGGQQAGGQDHHDGASDSGTHEQDANDDGSDGSANDGGHAGSGTHEGGAGGSGDDAHEGGSTSGSHDGDRSGDGSHRSGGDGGHDDGGASDSGGSRDGGNGGD
jgi:uncharacterized membrane protein YgcG